MSYQLATAFVDIQARQDRALRNLSEAIGLDEFVLGQQRLAQFCGEAAEAMGLPELLARHQRTQADPFYQLSRERPARSGFGMQPFPIDPNLGKQKRKK